MNIPAPRNNGFTLLEVLIALTIFAVAAGGFMTASGQSLRQMQALENKTIAGWVAENRLAELRAAHGWPDVGVRNDSVPMAGQDWQVRVTVTQTPHPDMRQLSVDVFSPSDSTSLITLNGFLGKY